MITKYKVFIKTNDNNYITDINSDAFISDFDGWTEIDRGSGDRYRHAQNHYFAEGLTDENGVYNYKYIDGDVIECTAEEKKMENFPSVVAKKISELSGTCTNTIYKGIDVTLADGSIEHFTLDEHDQLNLSGLALKLLMGATEIAWHEDDTTVPCKFYSAEDANTIINSLIAFKEYHITYYRDLRIYVNSLTTTEEVDSVVYGVDIPDEYKSDVLREYEKALGVVNETVS